MLLKLKITKGVEIMKFIYVCSYNVKMSCIWHEGTNTVPAVPIIVDIILLIIYDTILFYLIKCFEKKYYITY